MKKIREAASALRRLVERYEQASRPKGARLTGLDGELVAKALRVQGPESDKVSRETVRRAVLGRRGQLSFEGIFAVILVFVGLAAAMYVWVPVTQNVAFPIVDNLPASAQPGAIKTIWNLVPLLLFIGALASIFFVATARRQAVEGF